MSHPLTMTCQVKKYLEHRRSLGFALHVPGYLLMGFARFADRSGHRGPLTTELVLRWASQPEVALADEVVAEVSLQRRAEQAASYGMGVLHDRLLFLGAANRSKQAPAVPIN